MVTKMKTDQKVWRQIFRTAISHLEMKKQMRKRQGLVWKLIRKKIVSRMQNKKKHDSGEEMRCEVGREQAIPERWPCQQNFMPSQKTNRCASMVQERQGWSVCPPQLCVETELCPPLCSEGPGRVCCFSKNNNFVGGGKKNEKNKTPPGSGENSFFWREPAGGLKFFEAVGQARIPAGSEIFEKQAREKKKTKKKIPPKNVLSRGNEKHGRFRSCGKLCALRANVN